MIHKRCTQFFPPSLQETSNKGDNTINREWVKVGYNERKRERKREQMGISNKFI